jgi:hypothetical protein
MKTSALLRVLQDNPPKLIANGLKNPKVYVDVIDFERGFTTRDEMILMLGQLPEANLLWAGRVLGYRELKQMWLK